jgi:serine/threonine-protein kinase
MRVLKEGTRLAERYTLIRRLGSGGMAEIWLAGDSQTDSQVALKFLAAGFTENEAYRDLLRKEWRIGSNLMHAHIVRVFEFHDDPDGAYYSLQYISDVDLSVLCGKSPEDALPPLGLIADALRYAHAKGVVHRDIKAANVLLDGRGAPYLVDFGVAAIPAADGGVGGGTEIGASPQQTAGEAPRSADDIYALGVLLHELLTGAPPSASAPVTLTLPDGRTTQRSRFCRGSGAQALSRRCTGRATGCCGIHPAGSSRIPPGGRSGRGATGHQGHIVKSPVWRPCGGARHFSWRYFRIAVGRRREARWYFCRQGPR